MRTLPGNRRVANLIIDPPANVLTRSEIEQIVARDLATPERRLRGNSLRAAVMRDRRALIAELDRARAECTHLRERIGVLETEQHARDGEGMGMDAILDRGVR